MVVVGGQGQADDSLVAKVLTMLLCTLFPSPLSRPNSMVNASTTREQRAAVLSSCQLRRSAQGARLSGL